MGSTVRSPILPSPSQQLTVGSLRWRSWPLLDRPAWCWVTPAGIVLIGLFTFWVGHSWFVTILAATALAITVRSWFLPTNFEITPLGLRRRVMRHIRVVSWRSIRAYQVRCTGVVLYQRSNPTALDLPQSLFIPIPNEDADILVAMKTYLAHAVELTH